VNSQLTPLLAAKAPTHPKILQKNPEPAIRTTKSTDHQIKQAEEKEGYVFGSQLAPEIVREVGYQELYDLR